MTKSELAGIIDHTLLAQNATESEVLKLCDEAAAHNFASVCVNPFWVRLASERLSGSGVAVCTVVGFPLGAETSATKAFCAQDAISNGATEIDMVLNVGKAKDGDFGFVQSDIASVVHIAREHEKSCGKKIIVKVILETCLLSDEEVTKSCLAAKGAGADFVKTSTGFAAVKAADGSALPNGASVHHVALMKEAVGGALGIKASGGIRTADFARELIEAGATRIGTSSGVQIVEAW